jgi:hypothetical protein
MPGATARSCPHVRPLPCGVAGWLGVSRMSQAATRRLYLAEQRRPHERLSIATSTSRSWCWASSSAWHWPPPMDAKVEKSGNFSPTACVLLTCSSLLRARLLSSTWRELRMRVGEVAVDDLA